MAHTQALRHYGVAYVVAPYEADAQLAYLARTGVVELVISEDSDTIPYGCPQVGGGRECVVAMSARSRHRASCVLRHVASRR